MSSLSHTPRWRRSLDRIPRAKLTINLGDERDNAISLAELADIARSVQHTIDRIARSLNDSAEQAMQSDLLRSLSTLEAVSIDSRAGVLEIEAPADIEPFAIGSGEEDVGVQAIEIFVHRIGALSRGESPPVEIGQPAEKSLLSFAKAVGGHDRVWVTSQVGGTETVASFDPGSLGSGLDRLAPVPDASTSREIVGMLYGINLHTKTYRIEDGLTRASIFKLAEGVDDRAIVSLLGEMVHVRVVAGEADEKSSDWLTAVTIERVAPPETSDYYTWDFEKALAGVEPIKSIHDLAIPGIDEDEADAFWHAVND